ncbi:uncharacterized protein METZ01_LOCUS472457, partial [marine metagenome]
VCELPQRSFRRFQWQGPKHEQLDAFAESGMRTIRGPNGLGSSSRWSHHLRMVLGDEINNAQLVTELR